MREIKEMNHYELMANYMGIRALEIEEDRIEKGRLIFTNEGVQAKAETLLNDIHTEYMEIMGIEIPKESIFDYYYKKNGGDNWKKRKQNGN